MSYNDYWKWLVGGKIEDGAILNGESAAPVITITGSGNAPTINQSSVNPSSPVGISSTSAGTGSTFYQNGVGITPESSTGTGNVGSGNGSNNGGAGTGSNIYDTARDTANKNHQLGIDYAEGVKNSAYQSAEAATAEANRRAQNQYQRTVVDSQSAYQRAIGAYGSNAEALASRGLSGSGYGEWLQGNAYATHRGEVQAAAAQRLATQNDAAYKEAQAKAAADAAYGQFLYQNDVDKNNALLGIDEQEASDAEAKVNASFTTALDLLNKGWTIDEVQNYIGADAWAALGDKVGKLTTASEVANRIKAETEGKDAQGQLLSYLDLAASGQYNLDALVAIAKSLGQYDALSAKGADGTSLWDQVTNKVQSVTDKQTVQDMIDNGATAEDIKNSDAYNGLSDTEKGTVDNIITERDEGIKETEKNKQLAIEAAIEEAKDYSSLEDLNSDLVKEMVPESERSEIIAGWQKNNANEIISDLGKFKYADGQLVDGNGDPLTAADIYAGVKNGMFGDNAEAVIKKYVEAITTTTTLKGAIWAREQLGDLADEWFKDGADTNKLQSIIGAKLNEINNVFVVSVDLKNDSYREIDSNGKEHTGYIIDGVKFELPKYNYDGSNDEELNNMIGGQINDYSKDGTRIVYFNGNYYMNKHVVDRGASWVKLKLVK